MRVWAEIKMHCWQRQSRHASGVCDVHSQQSTTSAARYHSVSRQELGELGYTKINNLQRRLKRHIVDDAPGEGRGVWPKRRKHWYSGENQVLATIPMLLPFWSPVRIFCKGKHWADVWKVIKTMEARRQFLKEKELCPTGHWGKHCRNRGCDKCKTKHHTTLCNWPRGKETETPQSSNAVLNGNTPSFQERSLPVTVPLKLKGITFWAYLDTASRHRIGQELYLKGRD